MLVVWGGQRVNARFYYKRELGLRCWAWVKGKGGLDWVMVVVCLFIYLLRVRFGLCNKSPRTIVVISEFVKG